MSASKPTGPIPPWFVADRDDMLLLGGQRADDVLRAATGGEGPLFVYDASIVRQRMTELRQAMPSGLSIHYAIKANPFPALLAVMAGLVDGFDIASGGELDAALVAGMSPDRVSFAGPGKRDAELNAAIRAGVTINVESEGETARALAIAARLGVRARLAVRVNPPFEIKGSGMRMGGGAKPFGVDAERAAALARTIIDAGADWRGWHIFSGSQALDADAIIDAQRRTLALAGELSDAVGSVPPLLNLGGGFGVPYFAGDKALDVARIGMALADNADYRRFREVGADVAIELGRWLVAECGVYLTHVIDIKQSYGATFVVCDGGLNHQLAASGNFGTVVRRNYPIALANRFGGVPQENPVNVVGPLCTPLDRIGDNVALPGISPGDIIAVFLAGAYGLSASPAGFLSHGPAAEVVLSGDGPE